MRAILVPVLLACSVAACAQPPAPRQEAAAPAAATAPPPPAPAPATPPAPSGAQIAPGRWDVDRARCSDLLGASDDDRAAAAMFYYGYLAAKTGIHIHRVMDQCAAAPNMTVPEAFREALSRRS